MKSHAASGYHLNQLPIGSQLIVQTRNTIYEIAIRKDHEVWIRGHHIYCPDWTKIDFRGSHESSLFAQAEPFWIGVDMHMEWYTEVHGTITTSAVERITCHSNPKLNDASSVQPTQS